MVTSFTTRGAHVKDELNVIFDDTKIANIDHPKVLGVTFYNYRGPQGETDK